METLGISVGGLSFRVVNHPLPSFHPSFWGEVNAGRWEPHTFETFKKFLKPNRSYVDIGSWIGPTVLYGCQLAKHCYAVEPDPQAFFMLKDNIELNKFSNISTSEIAITDHNGEVKIGTFGMYGDSCTSFLSGTSVITVPCLTLEEFFVREKITDCNFIKIDTEGSEVKILASSKDFLQEIKPIIQVGLHSPHFLDKELYFSTLIDSLSATYTNFYLLNGEKKEWSFLSKLNWWNDIIVGT